MIAGFRPDTVRSSPAPHLAEIAALALDDGSAVMPGWHWQTDRAGRLTVVSESLSVALGQPPGALTGVAFASLLPGHVAGSGWHELVQAVEAGHPAIMTIDLNLRGERSFWQVAVRPLRDGSGQPAGMLGVARDITRERSLRQALEEELAATRRLSRRKSRFMSFIADDLRECVQTLSGFAEHLVSRNRGDKDIRGHLETMLAASQQLQNHLSLLADATRLECGRMKPAEQEADAAEITEIALKTCREKAASAEVTLVATLIDGIELRCDIARITQVVRRLVTTAISWSTPGGTVHVQIDLRPGDGGLALIVTGDGPAPLPANPADLFAPFAGLDAATLELPVARQVALLHAGDLTMEARPQGFAFVFTLPASRIIAVAGRSESVSSAG